ncbi:MAG TPA: hypothetical protein VGA09_17870, partial [Candidatus Binatia bacterium]
HAPENYVAGYGDDGIPAHDAIDIIKREPGQVSDSLVEHPFWLAAPELRELVAGKVPRRSNSEEITCFLNNLGIGLQFAAVGAAVFTEAKARGVGHEIPTDWFLESVHP